MDEEEIHRLTRNMIAIAFCLKDLLRIVEDDIGTAPLLEHGYHNTDNQYIPHFRREEQGQYTFFRHVKQHLHGHNFQFHCLHTLLLQWNTALF